MNYNVCSTCGASDGRAGVLIDGECLNCHNTNDEKMVLHTDLARTPEEINRMISKKILTKSKKSV